ncbi:Uncharacterised protein [Mycobacteroides abscessus subsp. abscessus]|nr:Uncharacterised protein [Mycobacteroides abscessus subsp. abscessus]
MGALDTEGVEHLCDGMCAVLEAEHPGERLAVAVAGRVDQDHGVAVGEIFGLGGPHRSRHQEAGPKEDDGSRASDPHMQPTEAALEVSVL